MPRSARKYCDGRYEFRKNLWISCLLKSVAAGVPVLARLPGFVRSGFFDRGGFDCGGPG